MRAEQPSRHPKLDYWLPPDEALTLGDAAPIGYRAPEPTRLRLVEIFERLVEAEPWRDEAACRGEPTEMFFTEQPDVTRRRAALAICGGCTVKEECGEYALEQGTRLQGMWGGMTTHKRRLILRERKRRELEREPLSTVEMPATGWPA